MDNEYEESYECLSVLTERSCVILYCICIITVTYISILYKNCIS